MNVDSLKSPDGGEKEVHLQYDARATARPMSMTHNHSD